MKKSALLTTLVILACSLFAEKVEIESAKIVAQNHYVLQYEQMLGKTPESTIILETFILSNKNNKELIYIFNFEKGFTLVSADNAITPILGFSLKGKYIEKDHSPAFNDLIEHYKDQISYVVEQRLKSSQETRNKWAIFNNMDALKRNYDCKIWPKIFYVNPLLTTEWNQKCYYNEKCPFDDNIVTHFCCCDHVKAGCVAIAMAQIMKRWNYPVNGVSSKGYYDGSQNPDAYGYQFADFGNTSYDWNSMPDQLTSDSQLPDATRSTTSEIEAVSTLIYHCGVSVETDYGIFGSYIGYEDTYKIVDSFKNYFNYISAAEFKEKDDYSENSWEYILRNNLKLKRPIYYQGLNNSNFGHAFVLDGYTKLQTEWLTYYALFHINWGSEDLTNGYFFLSDLTPGESNFNYYQGAIVNIEPKNINYLPPPKPNYISEPACYPHCRDVEVEYSVPTVEEATAYEWDISGIITAAVYCNGRYATVWSHKSGNAMLRCRALNHGVPGPWQTKTIYIENCNRGSEPTSNENIIDKTDELLADTEENFISKEINIRPNPVRNKIYISLPDKIKYTTIQLFNNHGKLIKSLNVNDKEITINVTEIKNGIYFIKISSSNSVEFGKIIISK